MLRKILYIILVIGLLFTSVGYAQVKDKKSLPKPATIKKQDIKKSVVKPKINNKQNEVNSSKTPAPKDSILALQKIEFSLKDLEGGRYISKDIFGNNKLTMINFWGTLCNPCIKELPELQEINDEMADKKFGIIGVVGDVTGSDGKEEAITIIRKKQIKFLNLIPDDKMNKDLLSKMTGYPVSIFVDSQGNIVGDVLTGAKSKDEYIKTAEQLLSTLK